MPGFWDRLRSRRKDEAARLHEDEAHMSDSERELLEGDIEDVSADEAVVEHLGGFNPNRLVEDDEPPRL